jgi:predicted dehydrogenase
MKLVMIGVRGHYGLVYQSLSDLPDMEVAGISAGSDDDISVLRQGLRERGYAPAEFSDYREMLDKIKPDYVCIAGPFELHAEMCIEALKRNAHVFCEKPVAITLEELDKLKEACAARPRLRLISMVSMRYAGNYLAAYAAVKAGKIGKVLMIDARKSYKLGNRPEYYRHFETYGGTIPWVGIHVIDMIYYFAGSGFKKIFATQTRENNFDHGDLEIAAHCQFAMQNGVLAACSVDFLRPQAAPSHGDTRLRVAGTRGVLELIEDGIHDGVKLINADGNRNLASMPEGKIFFDFVRGPSGELLPCLDARATFEVTGASLLARESAETGEVIALP